MSASPPKIFGIGFHKTATTSLADALQLLGYTVTGPNEVDNPRIAEIAWPLAQSLVPRFDAFQDNPWPLLYRQLDETYPNSKFILTLRPAESWIKSVVKHFGRDSTPMREWIYGVGFPKGNEEIYLARYARHNAEVRAYFADKSDRILELSITEGDGWEKLCPFLGVAVPDLPFPHANSIQDRLQKGKDRKRRAWRTSLLGMVRRAAPWLASSRARSKRG